MKRTLRGFTVIEMLVVISIIGILATASFVSYNLVQANVRDSERSSRVKVIAEALEKYYDKNGEYPSCSAMAQPANTVVISTLPGVDPNVLAVPTASNGTNSILASCADLSVGVDAFAYIGTGSNCSTTACLQYTIKYREEGSGNPITLPSRRVALAAVTVAAPSAPAMTVVLNSPNVLATITPAVSCGSGSTAYYAIDSRTNDGAWTGFSNWSSTVLTSSTTAVIGVKYGYRAEAKCLLSNNSYSAVALGVEATPYIHPISAPTPPTVSATTNYGLTTFSWTAVTCSAGGTTAKYQYRYVVDYSGGYTSNWYTTTGLSAVYNTYEEGWQYGIEVQASCVSTSAASAWTASATTNYIHAVAGPGTITFGITRAAANIAYFWFTTSCTGNASLYARDDIFLTTPYGGLPYNWTGYAGAGWYADVHGGAWVDNTFTNYAYSYHTQTTITPTAIPTGMPWTTAIEARCQNPTTGRMSASTGRLQSGSLIMP
ncbi:MAG: type II secretion system protein [Candidatus Saccharibacteria bacterium]